MKKLLHLVDERVNLVVILLLFWALFWGLNGADKFFDSELMPNLRPGAASSVVVDGDGEVVSSIHPREPMGFYGVNRDAKMIDYFSRIGLPAWVALSALYGMAVAEIVLGLMFLATFFWSLLPTERQKRFTLFADRTIQRLAFKGSVLIFVIFSAGDILFGDRIELWEHGTFLIMCLMTYNAWFKVESIFRDLQGDPSSRRTGGGSLQSAMYD